LGLLDLGWLRSFAALHQAAKAGEVRGRDLDAYRSEREAMARALLEAQKVTLEPDQKPRFCLRVARGIEVTIHRCDQDLEARTLNIAAAGFAAVLQTGLRSQEEVGVTLTMPEGDPLRARARVIEVRPSRTAAPDVRVGFQFMTMSEADLERLEVLVFDVILEHLRS